jgi:ADP-ribose pyrophosphatase
MEVESVRTIYNAEHLLINSSHYYDNNGDSKQWYWAERPNLISAVMVAAMHGDKLVLIKEFRVPLNGYIWGLPAGLVEHGESPEETAEREIVEETGLTIINKIRASSPVTYTSPGITNESMTMVFAEVTGTPNTKLNESSEDIEVHLLTRVEVASIIQRGGMIDAKAYLIMLRFVEDGKI